METDIKIKPCKKVETFDSNKKPNGWLLEIISDRDAFTENLTGQVYLTTIKPGEEKGFHVHAGAKYFVTCLKGRIKSVIYTDRFNKQEIQSGDGNFKTYELPLGSAHLLSNKGDKEEAYVLIYRFPSWSPDFKEQLDISPEEIDTEETWRKINSFVKKIQLQAF
ncbi:MAG: hypothetical protein AAB338_01270 [Patescibacteria group bacterium]